MKAPRTTTTHRALRAKEFREQQLRYEASGKFRHDWVVYAKSAPSGPAEVLDSLARYIRKVAISNHCITGLADGVVSFRVRDPQRPKAGRITSLPAPEFIRRGFMHVLPQGFKRIRHYGLLASGHKAAKLAICRALLDVPTPQPAVVELVAAFMARVARADIAGCPRCVTGQLRFLSALAPVRSAVNGGSKANISGDENRKLPWLQARNCRACNHDKVYRPSAASRVRYARLQKTSACP